MPFQGRIVSDDREARSPIPSTGSRPAVSAIVTTFNEEKKIEACLDSLSWCDDVLVIDSFSDDRTCEIVAATSGVRLLQRQYYGGASQKNWAIDRVEHDWIFILDADERCTPELREEIERLLEGEPSHSSYRIPRRVYFLGRLIRFSGWQRDRVVRLFRRGAARYPDRRVHADMETRGEASMLRHPIEHYMADDFRTYAARVFKYSYWGAADAWKLGLRTNVAEIVFRGTWRFFRTYGLQLGFLDGGRGFVFCALQAFGTYAKWATLWSWRLQSAAGAAPELPEFDEDERTFRPLRGFETSLGPSSSVVFLTHVGKEYPVRKFLDSWGQDVEEGVLSRIYPGTRPSGATWAKRWSERFRSRRTPRMKIDSAEAPAAGVYIFSDLERLTSQERPAAVALYEHLRRFPGSCRALNDPARFLDRFDLLRALHEKGINDFNVYRPELGERPPRWPVLLRHRTRHGALLSGLLHSAEELETALAALESDANPPQDTLIVEFSETRDEDDVYRKYGAFSVGDQIVARQIHFSRDWFLRHPDIRTFESSEEELVYVLENPDAEQLRRVFDVAGVEYGRIDYARRPDGGLSVWEINTNPMILIPADRNDLLRFRAHEHFARRFISALESL